MRTRGLVLLAALALPAAAGAQVAKANFLAEGSFALPTAGPGAMERPRALAWAPGNQIHVADERGTVNVFSAAGAFVRAYGAPTVKKVASLAVDGAGRAYVLDPDQKIVFVFDTTGAVVRRIGSPGGDAGMLQEPLDVAVGPSGLVYVLDKGRKGVQIFSLDGTFVHDVLLPLEAKDPRALAVSPSGRVYVADKERPGALVRLPALTVALATVDAPPPEVDAITVRGARLENPVAVVATSTGTVVAADRDTGVLWLVDGAAGALVGADDKLYGGKGSGRGSFRRLDDIAVAGADELVALDSDGRKVERIKLVLEAQRAAEAVLDYPVQFESFAPTVDPGVLAAAPRASGTAWIALADAEGRNLRVVEARMIDRVGAFGGRVRVPEVAAGAATHRFGTVVPQAGYAALNDTLFVVTEPRRNRFHVFDLRTGTPMGAFGDGYSDGRRLRDPRGIALYADGRVAVADHGNDRVAVFSADVATLLGTFPLPKAQGVAVAPDGRLYAWDEEGLTVGRLPVSGSAFQALPAGLSAGGVSGLAVDGAGNLYALRRGTSRVAVLAAGSDRIIARVGGHRGIERGDRLAVDPDGNVYATDSEKGTTVVARWGVDLPPVRALTAGWTAAAADLAWEAVPGSFVAGYQIEGAAAADGPWTRVAAPTGTSARVQDGALRYYRVATRALTGAIGRPSPVAAVLHLGALDAFGARAWDRARALATEALDLVAAGGARADAAALRALRWAGFVSASELGDDPDVLAWDRRLGDTIAADVGFEHGRRMALSHQRLGDRAAASRWARRALSPDAGGPVAPADQRAAMRQLVFDNAWEAGAWADAVAMGEDILTASGGAAELPLVEKVALAHMQVGSATRARALVDGALAASPAAGARRRLEALGFMATAALAEYPQALELAATIGDGLDADLIVPFQAALARVRLETGDRPGARAAIVTLMAGGDAARLTDPAVASSALAVFGAFIEAGEADVGRGMLDTLVAALPAAARPELLRQADSVAAVADTRLKLGEGFAYYRDAIFRDALRFFQAADTRTDLDVDQKLIVKELLAGSYHSLSRPEDADEVYRAVYQVDPEFNLVAHVEKVLSVYGLTVFTEEMLAHFSQVGPGAR